MLVGVVSDTHGQVDYTRAATNVLSAAGVELVLHCGDIGGELIPALFSPWPTHFVFGNVDRDEARLRQAIKAAGHFCHDRFADLEVAGKRVAVVHGDDQRKKTAAVDSGEFDLVCYGHTHVAESHAERGVLVLNPGAVYRANPHSVAVVTFPELEVELLNVP